MSMRLVLWGVCSVHSNRKLLLNFQSLYMNPASFPQCDAALLLGSGAAYATNTMKRSSYSSMPEKVPFFFTDCYAYAVFPTIGAGASSSVSSEGQVYVHDRLVAAP